MAHLLTIERTALWATCFSYVDHASTTTLRLRYFVWLAPCRSGRNELRRVRLQGVLEIWREPRLGWKAKGFRLNVSKTASLVWGPDMSDGPSRVTRQCYEAGSRKMLPVPVLVRSK
jgi:hypothetical protein